MLPEPLHPMTVHVPLALAALMPLLALVALGAAWRGWLAPRPAWWGVVALQAMLALSAFVAVRTGENEEDRVEKVAPRAAVHDHEEAAEQFRNSAVGTLVVALAAGWLRRETPRRLLAALAIAAMGMTLVLAWRTGTAGGELVYRHGAAEAYRTAAPAPAPPPSR